MARWYPLLLSARPGNLPEQESTHPPMAQRTCLFPAMHKSDPLQTLSTHTTSGKPAAWHHPAVCHPPMFSTWPSSPGPSVTRPICHLAVCHPAFHHSACHLARPSPGWPPVLLRRQTGRHSTCLLSASSTRHRQAHLCNGSERDMLRGQEPEGRAGTQAAPLQHPHTQVSGSHRKPWSGLSATLVGGGQQGHMRDSGR